MNPSSEPSADQHAVMTAQAEAEAQAAYTRWFHDPSDENFFACQRANEAARRARLVYRDAERASSARKDADASSQHPDPT